MYVATGDAYAFMLPVAAGVSSCCQLAGIGGAAIFSPIFLLGFPALGAEYPLDASAAIASALLTEVFGFSSGLTGFTRRGLVDWSTAAQFAIVAVPAALCGALGARFVAADPSVLRGVYAVLMLSLAALLALGPSEAELAESAAEQCSVDLDDPSGAARAARDHTAADGRVFTYLAPVRGSVGSSGATASGGILTGLLGVGIGEVVLPQLVRGSCMPLPLAAGTSVATVVVTAAAAATLQFAALAADTGGDLSSAVPWNLVRWTIPGVLIGGQIAPQLAGRLPDDLIARVAAAVFGLVGVLFAIKAFEG